MKKEIVNPKIQEELNLKTNQLLSFVQDTRCRQQLINEYFTGEESTEVCGSCDVCQNTLKTVDIRESAVHAFKAVALTNGERGISSLAKLLCGIELHRFSVEEQNTSVFGSMKKYPVTEVKSFLRYLVQRGYINYLPSSFDGNNGSLSLTLNAIDLSNSKKPLYAPLLTQDKDQRSPLGPD